MVTASNVKELDDLWFSNIVDRNSPLKNLRSSLDDDASTVTGDLAVRFCRCLTGRDFTIRHGKFYSMKL